MLVSDVGEDRCGPYTGGRDRSAKEIHKEEIKEYVKAVIFPCELYQKTCRLKSHNLNICVLQKSSARR